MNLRLLARAAPAFAGALWISARASGTDCAGPARAELTLALVSLEPLDTNADVATERARLGETARFSGVRSTARDVDGGRRSSVYAWFVADHDSYELEATP